MISLLGVPLLIIPIIGSVFTWIPAGNPYLRGAASIMSFFAVGMVILFQLYGGTYSMEYVKDIFFSPMKWRIGALPCTPATVVLAILIAGTLVSMVQGTLLILFTRVILGVRWGNLGVAFLTLLGTTLLAQLVYVVILLLVRIPGLAAGLAWMFPWGSAALGGLMFPLPSDSPFFRFMTTYGTPYSLARTAISSGGASSHQTVLCIGCLFLASALIAGIIALLGRKRLA